MTIKTINYFAYGSNMCTHRLKDRVPSARPLGIAYLIKHTLRFHKKSKDGSAKADAMYTGNAPNSVWGVVFEIDGAEKSNLDTAEGLGQGYWERWVTVSNEVREYHALTYLATNVDSYLKPYTWYMRYVIEGAKQHHLPEDYLQAIEATAAIQDPDQARDQRERLQPC